MSLRTLAPASLVICALAIMAGCIPVATDGPGALSAMNIASVSIDVGVGSPIPVDAFISGELPDICAQLGEVRQELVGSEFRITLSTFEAPGEDCMRDTLPFRIAVPINTVSLPEGEYTVVVNGAASATFTMPIVSPAIDPTAGSAATLTVDTVEVRVGAGSPTPVDAIIGGTLPTACDQIGSVQQWLENNAFRITVSSFAPSISDCDATRVPYRIVVPLNVTGLPAGEYTVWANEAVSTMLTLPVEQSR